MLMHNLLLMYIKEEITVNHFSAAADETVAINGW